MNQDIGQIKLRRAVETDAPLVFAWRNDPWIVERSSSQRPLTWDEHAPWFAAALRDPDRLIFVVEEENVPIGLVRFDKVGADECVITAYLLKQFTGRGLGVQAIRVGCEDALRAWPDMTRIVACVREENRFAMAGFAKAGFTREGEGGACPAGHTRLALRRAANSRSVETDHARSIEFFTGLIAEHGIHPLALNWGGAKSQELRFAVLAECGVAAGASVLDVGCGLGDFFAWQQRCGLAVRYRGVDLTPRMVEVARSRFPEVSFEVADLLVADVEPADYVLASGIFYLRQHEPLVFMERMIGRMFQLCRKAVAFNSLSGWADAQDPGEFYADPSEVMALCRRLTPWVTFRHDYHTRDFSVYLYREPRRA